MESGMRVPRLCEEVAGAKLRDQRLTRRLMQIIESLGARPHESIPAATAGRAEMEATYRFLMNGKVKPEEILAPHYEWTRQRCAQQPLVLLVQDTTAIDLTRPNKQMAGVGPLENGDRVGAFLHPLLAITPEGVPLGLAWSTTWTRPVPAPSAAPLTLAERRRRKRQTPLESKESFHWLEGLRQSRAVAEACPQTHCVCIADSAGDVFELFAEPRQTRHVRAVDLLVRACQDRALVERGQTLLTKVRATPLLYTCQINISERKEKVSISQRRREQPREARVAHLEVRSTSVTLQAPRRFVGHPLSDQCLQVVLVEEPSPPAGQIPVQWLLLTSVPLSTHAEVREVVCWYARRWEIEVYFKTLKSGCRIEERDFEALGRELNFVAVALLIAWRVLLLCRLGRECPEIPCDVVFTPAEWKSMWMKHHEHRPWAERLPPEEPPPLGEMVQWVARLGGHVIRSPGRRTVPGTQTLWIGLACLTAYAQAWDLFGPGKNDPRWFFRHHRTCVEQ
jgi:hypothetical protein